MSGRSVLAAIVLGFSGLCSADLYEWSATDGGNGHFYEAVHVPTGIDWEGANTAATARGGYLATITSAAENALVYGLVDDPALWRDTGPVNGEGPFIGGYRFAWDSSDPAANWAWVSGEPWSYSNWVPIEPSGDATQNALHFFGYYSRMGPLWNDLPSVGYIESGYIIEYDHDPTVVPTPGAVMLCVLGLGYSGRRLTGCAQVQRQVAVPGVRNH